MNEERKRFWGPLNFVYVGYQLTHQGAHREYFSLRCGVKQTAILKCCVDQLLEKRLHTVCRPWLNVQSLCRKGRNDQGIMHIRHGKRKQCRFVGQQIFKFVISSTLYTWYGFESKSKMVIICHSLCIWHCCNPILKKKKELKTRKRDDINSQC